MTEHVARKLDLRRKLLLAAAGLMAVAVPVAFGQPSLPPFSATPPGATVNLPEFEVVSIKPNKSGTRMVRVQSPPDGFSATNISLKFIVSMAYGVRQDLISGGPGWIDSDRYDIEAKVAGLNVAQLQKLSFDQRRKMLQPLLVDRFKLKVHSETKMFPVYALVIAKGGPTLHEAKPGDTYANGIKGPDGTSHGWMQMGRGQITGQGIPISNVATALTDNLHRTVVDKTGLMGKYDIALKWTPDEGTGMMMPGAPGAGPPGSDSAPPPDTGPSIFTAVQEQLGLKLESTKGPVETLVIDHAEPPSEN